MLYESAGSFAVDAKRDHGLMRPWMLGDGAVRWMYSTLFNPSPLGFELYLYQHVRLGDVPLSLYLKYGRPFDNYGVGLGVPRLLAEIVDQTPILRAGLALTF
jgi:hypothetical protein